MKSSWPVIRRHANAKTGYESWCVDSRSLNGEQKYFSTKKEAEEFAELKRKEKANIGIALANISEDEKIKALYEYKRAKEAGFTLQEAVNSFSKSHAPCVDRTIQGIVDELVSYKESLGRREDYYKTLGYVLFDFAKAFEDRQLKCIEPDAIKHWLESKKWTNTTKRNVHNNLILLYNYAIKNNYATSNPLLSLDKPSKDETEIGILSVEETQKLLEFVRGKPEEAYFLIGALCGLRAKEIERLNWSDINLDAKIITVIGAKAKTRQTRHVTIEPILLLRLKEIAQKKGPVVTKTLRVGNIAKSAGISRFPKNCLRHGYASYLIAYTKDAARVAHELGHRNVNLLYSNYRALVEESDAIKYWNMVL